MGSPRHHIEEHQSDWNKFVQHLTYADSTQTHSTTNATPLGRVLTWELPAASEMIRQSAVLLTIKESLISQELCSVLFNKIGILGAISGEASAKAQRHYKPNFGIKIRYFLVYDKDILVYLRDDLLRRDNNPSHRLKPNTQSSFVVATTTSKLSKLRKAESTTLSVLKRCWWLDVNTKIPSFSSAHR